MEESPYLRNKYLRVWIQNAHYKFIDFIFQVKYVIIFYLVGDILTTFLAIEKGIGYEGNPIISKSIEHSGLGILIVIKLLFLLLFYIEYLYLENKQYHTLWTALKYSLIVFGILVVTNNIIVILDFTSPIYVLCTWIQ